MDKNYNLLINSIERYGIKLRFVEVEDAEFILSLRNDERLGKFLSKTSNDLSDQVNWIKKYKEREKLGEEFYFVVEDLAGIKYGVTRISELKEGSAFELGSWLFSRASPSGMAIKADIIAKEIGFDQLGFNLCKFNVRKENTSVLNYHLRYMPIKVDETDLDTFFNLSKENFNNGKKRFLKFL